VTSTRPKSVIIRPDRSASTQDGTSQCPVEAEGLEPKPQPPVRFGDMAEDAKRILVDAFGRVRELVIDLTDGLTDEIATYRPDPEANSIAWLLWHLTRSQDHQVADLAQVEQVWPQWRERFGLPFDKWATGYGQGPKEVAAVRVSGDLLGDYHRDVHELTLRYLDGITDEELDRIVDTHWDPPVTAAVRLVSVVGDTMQHAGQAAYVRGLAKRRDKAGGAGGVPSDYQQPGR
jgi:uncharacterized damage-inducible protein DinB